MIARVEDKVGGPRLYINNILVKCWLASNSNANTASELALELNKSFEDSWISVKEKLPLSKDDTNTYVDVLVTVEPKNPESCDDRQVMLLCYIPNIGFCWNIAGKLYEENHSWRVIAWKYKPEPYKG